MLKVEVW
jgi:hypothetical protein